MKLLCAIFMLGISSLSFADVTAADVIASNNALKQACAGGVSSQCGAAYTQNQNMSNQLNREIAASISRGEPGDQRRVRIQEEERWREEVRRR